MRVVCKGGHCLAPIAQPSVFGQKTRKGNTRPQPITFAYRGRMCPVAFYQDDRTVTKAHLQGLHIGRDTVSRSHTVYLPPELP
jgi:hypothetical protein